MKNCYPFPQIEDACRNTNQGYFLQEAPTRLGLYITKFITTHRAVRRKNGKCSSVLNTGL
jgi:hypothetical protein